MQTEKASEKMEKWNEICYLINNHRKTNSNEKYFQIEIENIFEKLGWSRYRNEIVSQQNIRIGSVNTIKPDITIKLDGKNVFVIELKQPNLSSTQTHAEQLISYMRQLKLDFGFLIDHSFHFYYDAPTDDKEPLEIFKTEFIENNEEALSFLKLLEKENFCKEKLTSFCKTKIEELNNKNIANEIVTDYEEHGEKKLISLLIKDLKNSYNDCIIDNVISKLTIVVKRKIENNYIPEVANKFEQKKPLTNQKSDLLPIEFIPNDEKLFKKLLLENKRAFEEIHYENGKIDKKVWNAVKFNDSSNLRGNVRSRPYARKGKWKELGISKIVYIINHY